MAKKTAKKAASKAVKKSPKKAAPAKKAKAAKASAIPAPPGLDNEKPKRVGRKPKPVRTKDVEKSLSGVPDREAFVFQRTSKVPFGFLVIDPKSQKHLYKMIGFQTESAAEKALKAECFGLVKITYTIPPNK